MRKPRQGNADEASYLNKEICMSAIHQPDPTSRIILGIDSGVAIVGYAVVEARGDALRMIACDVIRFLTIPPLLKFIPQKTVFWGIVLQETKGDTYGAVDCSLWKRSRDTP